MKQFRRITFFSFVLIFVQASLALAQTPRPTPTNVPESTSSPTTESTSTSGDQAGGTIRGTVYEDVNQDGSCADGDPVVVGVPLQFVSNDGETAVFLQSGDDGTYGLAAAGYGTWQVSAVPNAPWRVTSTSPVSAFIDGGNPVALGIDFCVTDAEVTTTAVFLPSSGVAFNPTPFILALLLGFSLIISGAFVYRRGR